MDYETARRFLIEQITATESNTSDTLLKRLNQGKPPVPGQITSILLALKVVFAALSEATTIDRELANTLHLLSVGGQKAFETGRRNGVDWPPLLREDLQRIAIACESVFANVWQSVHWNAERRGGSAEFRRVAPRSSAFPQRPLRFKLLPIP